MGSVLKSSPTSSNAPISSKDRGAGKGWIRRHPFICAFAALSVLGILLSALVHRTMWGYVVAPPPLAAEIQSIVAVDAFYYFRSEFGTATKQTSMISSFTPKEALRGDPARPSPFLRLLRALEDRGRMPANWIESSSIPATDVLDLVITGEGSYGRSPSDIKYFTGQVLLGRDQQDREFLFISSLDVTGFPDFFDPYFEFVFIRTGNDAKWELISRQTFNKGDRELHWLLSMPVFIGLFELSTALLLGVIWGGSRIASRMQSHERSFEAIE